MTSIRSLLFVALLVVGACGAEAPAPSGGTSSGLTTRGGSAPDFSVQTFADGTFSLRDQRGKIVVLNFFESW